MDRTIIFLDTETGGLNPKVNSLLSIGCIAVDGETLEEIDSFYKEIKYSDYTDKNDKWNVTCKAIEINKLSPEYLEKSKSADSFDNVKKQFREWLYQYYEPKYKPIPAGHNILQFDKPFLEHQLGLKWDKCFYHHPIDTMIIADFLLNAGMIKCGSSKLDDLAKYFEVDTGDRSKRHDSLDDARISKEVYVSMIVPKLVGK